MPFLENINVCNDKIIIEDVNDGEQVVASGEGTNVGTVRHTGLNVLAVSAYDIVLYDKDGAKYFAQGGTTYSVVNETKVILITQQDIAP